jgi:hypothetical protein
MTLPTEAERNARLCKRAGCDCEEKAMTDPTLDTLIEPVCVYCDKAPWDKHGARCEPCAKKLTRDACVAEVNLYIKGENDRIRLAVEAEREACAVACIDRWTTEPNITRRNGLSHGAIAGAATIRARGERDAD